MMRNVMKLILGIMFSFIVCISAKAQTYPANPTDPSVPQNTPANPENTPAPDDIICLETDNNVFECSVNDPNFGDGEIMEDFQIIDEYNDVDLYNDEMNQNNYLDNPNNGNIIIEDDQTIEDRQMESEPVPGTDFTEEQYIEKDNLNRNENEYEELNDAGSQEKEEIIIQQPSEETTAFI